jgi:hypothetical protein
MRSKTIAASMLGAAFATAVIGTTVINAAVGGSDTTVQPTEQVNPQLATHFAILRKPASSDTSLQSAQSAEVMADTGVNPSLTRTGARAGSDLALVTPSQKGLCLGSKELGILTCGDSAEAISGTVVGAIICGRLPVDQVEVLGAFPDDVKQVEAELSDGTTATYPINDNTFVQQFDKSRPVPLYFSFTAGGAPQRTRTGVPTEGSLAC